MMQSNPLTPHPSGDIPAELIALPDQIGRFSSAYEVRDYLLNTWKHSSALSSLIPNKAFFYKDYLLVCPPAGQASMNRLNINKASQHQIQVAPTLLLSNETRGTELLVFQVGTSDPNKLPCITDAKNITHDAKNNLVEDLKTYFLNCNSVNDSLIYSRQMVRYNTVTNKIIILDWGTIVRSIWQNEDVNAYQNHVRHTLDDICLK